jgi:hypothetical protein
MTDLLGGSAGGSPFEAAIVWSAHALAHRVIPCDSTVAAGDARRRHVVDGSRVRPESRCMADDTPQRFDAASTWRLLGLVVPALDARVGWRRRRRAMSDAEVEADLAMLGRVPGAIEAWSEGNVRVPRIEVVVAEGPLERLARVGGGWWADPDALAPLLQAHLARLGGVDSVIALYPADGTHELRPAWGYTWGEVAFLGGAGVSSIVSADWHRWPSMADAEHGFVHEWLHQVESVYRRLGVGEDDLPGLHDVADRRTARPDAPDRTETYVEFERRTGSWRPWYRDYMTGTIGPRSDEAPRVRGLTRERWLLRPGA